MSISVTSGPPDVAPGRTASAGPLVVVSHRGPVEFADEDGERVAHRGAGGLVTAFSGLGSRLEDTVWVCAAMNDADRAVAAEHPKAFSVAEAEGWRLRMLDIEAEPHRQFYAMIANPLLWFIQHGLWDLSDAPDIGPAEHAAWRDGYVAVNAAFADAVLDEIGDQTDASVLVQDYHLYLVPGLVRDRSPHAFVNFFCHIPWPQPDAWRVLPPAWRRAIFEGILGADIVGFHTERYARNFLAGCEQLLGLEVDARRLEVVHDGRRVAARWYPISVDAQQFEELAADPAVLRHEADLVAARREQMILRVDRTDLSKNILRGFRAYDLLLDRHPELRERVTFLALLQPSRQDVTEYVDYLERIRRTVADLNLKHGTPDWQPVDLRLVDDMNLAVAAYKQFDVLLVNAIADGMNLVAKEAILVNERNGVLLLSETTGAHAELGRMAVTVYPFDVDQQADALWTALTMDADEREGRREACTAVVRRNDLHRWLEVQLEDRAALDRTG
ncbi:MAG: glycosyltransferase family 20 protein [Acidimicrobiales bacterium]